MGQENKRSHHSQIVQVEQNLWFSVVQENKFRLCKQICGQPAASCILKLDSRTKGYPAQGQQPNNRLERCKRATTDNLRLSPVCTMRHGLGPYLYLCFKLASVFLLAASLHLFLPVVGKVHCPVRIVGADGCFNLESLQNFEKHSRPGHCPTPGQRAFPQ